MSSSNRSSSVRIGGDGQLLGSEAQHAAGRHRRQGLRVERGGQRRGHDLGVGLQRGAREAGWWGCRDPQFAVFSERIQGVQDLYGDLALSEFYGDLCSPTQIVRGSRS
jgi:hypothetical protein